MELVIRELGAPVPPPPPPPVEEGQRRLVIIRETEETTPALARTLTALRTGTVAQYFASKGHTLDIVDDDSVDQSGQPVKWIEDLESLGVPEPAFFILDPQTTAVIYKQPLPATPGEILAAVKANGG